MHRAWARAWFAVPNPCRVRFVALIGMLRFMCSRYFLYLCAAVCATWLFFFYFLGLVLFCVLNGSNPSVVSLFLSIVGSRTLGHTFLFFLASLFLLRFFSGLKRY